MSVISYVARVGIFFGLALILFFIRYYIYQWLLNAYNRVLFQRSNSVDTITRMENDLNRSNSYTSPSIVNSESEAPPYDLVVTQNENSNNNTITTSSAEIIDSSSKEVVNMEDDELPPPSYEELFKKANLGIDNLSLSPD